MALSNKRELKKTKVEIIPMIDTMFFLLVFFILSSIGVIKLQGINIDLPDAAPANTPPSTKKTAQLTIAIDKNENITVDNRPVPSGQDIGATLQREMDRQVGPGSDPGAASVVISADPLARQGTVVRCIDQARNLKITNFAIATKEDNGGSGGSGIMTAPAAPGTP